MGIRLFIAAPNLIIKSGLEVVLSKQEILGTREGFKFIGGTTDRKTAAKQIADSNPDVAVIDIGFRYPIADYSLIKEVVSKTIPILVVSQFPEQTHAQPCMMSGAKGYVRMDDSVDAIVEGIYALAQGKSYFDERIKLSIDPSQALTERLYEVYTLLGEGLTHKEIAKKLKLSVKTIDGELGKIRDKLGFYDSNELQVHAVDWVYTNLKNPTYIWNSIKDPDTTLTEQEEYCFSLVGRGMGSGEIGKKISRSYKTVDAILRRVCKKMDFKHRPDLVMHAALWVAGLGVDKFYPASY